MDFCVCFFVGLSHGFVRSQGGSRGGAATVLYQILGMMTDGPG